MLHVTSAKYLSGYKIWVAFDDDTSGEVDLELETVVWPNGADLAPEFLKELQLN